MGYEERFPENTAGGGVKTLRVLYAIRATQKTIVYPFGTHA